MSGDDLQGRVPDVPDVDAMFEFRHLLCAIHGELLRDQWPTGYAAIVIALAHEFLHDPRTWRACGWSPDDRTRLADNERLQGALDDAAPLCCRYPSAWRRGFEEGGAGRRGYCRGCGHFRLGAPYQMRDPRSGEVQRYPHFCVECVSAGARRANQIPPI